MSYITLTDGPPPPLPGAGRIATYAEGGVLKSKDAAGMVTILGGNIDTRLSAIAAAGATTLAVKNPPRQNQKGLWVIVDPFSEKCEIRRVELIDGTAVVAALTNSHAADTLVRFTEHPEANPLLFGAIGTHSSAHVAADTAGVQAALNCAKEQGIPFVGVGGFYIDTPLTLHRVTGFRMYGLGMATSTTTTGSGGMAGLTFYWAGPPGVPCFDLTDVRESHFCDFRIEARTILNAGWWCRNMPDGITAAQNLWEDVLVVGQNTTNYVEYGWRITTLNGGLDQNNDFHVWKRCQVRFFKEAGVSIEHSQAKMEMLEQCQFLGTNFDATGGLSLSKAGVTTALGTGGQFTWKGGFIAHCETTFLIGQPNDAIVVDSLQSEGCSSYMRSTGNAGAIGQVLNSGVRWNPIENLAADKKIVDWMMPGPFTYLNCEFENRSTTNNGGYLNHSCQTKDLTFASLVVQNTIIETTSLTPIVVQDGFPRYFAGNSRKLVGSPDHVRIPDRVVRLFIPATAFAQYSGLPPIEYVGDIGDEEMVGYAMATGVLRSILTSLTIDPKLQSETFTAAPYTAPISIRIVWAPLTAGSAGQNVRFTAKATAVALDGTTTTTVTNDFGKELIVAVPTTAYRIVESEVVPSSDAFRWFASPGEIARLVVTRRGDLTTEDTFPGTIAVLGVILQYNAHA